MLFIVSCSFRVDKPQEPKKVSDIMIFEDPIEEEPKQGCVCA